MSGSLSTQRNKSQAHTADSNVNNRIFNFISTLRRFFLGVLLGSGAEEDRTARKVNRESDRGGEDERHGQGSQHSEKPTVISDENKDAGERQRSIVGDETHRAGAGEIGQEL
jgi:hypothetical protein